ncbi:MAG: hypothetical protein GXO74_04250 [Calditrichaeota bacterium]|nr:hypothetical protein [Calditrichota bacterium]
MNLFSRPRIGLALGGGGARGFAHIGVLKVFHQEKIPFDLISGASAGSLIGAMYSQLADAQKIEDRVKAFLASETYHKLGLRKTFFGNQTSGVFSHLITHLKETIVINLAHRRNFLIPADKFMVALEFLLEDGFIQDGILPFCAVASDIISGEDVYMTHGPIRTAVLASSSIPGFLPPVERDGKLLLDGAVTQKVPVQAAQLMGADVVIAVDVSQELGHETEYDNILEIINRTSKITSDQLTQFQMKSADAVIRPEVGKYHWFEFDRVEQFINAGEDAAREALPKIRKVISRRHVWKKNSFSRLQQFE